MEEIKEFFRGIIADHENAIVELMSLGKNEEANLISDNELSWASSQLAIIESLGD